MFCHIKCCVCDVVGISTAFEQREEAFVLRSGDRVECKLVERFEEPGTVRCILAFGAEDLRKQGRALIQS